MAPPNFRRRSSPKLPGYSPSQFAAAVTPQTTEHVIRSAIRNRFLETFVLNKQTRIYPRERERWNRMFATDGEEGSAA